VETPKYGRDNQIGCPAAIGEDPDGGGGGPADTNTRPAGTGGGAGGMPVEGYAGDMTGPGITDQWGVTCADLGVSIVGSRSTSSTAPGISSARP
jgi:hypothetical protein